MRAHHGIFDVVVPQHAWGYEDILVAKEAGAAAVQLRELCTSHCLKLGPVLGRHTVPDLHHSQAQLKACMCMPSDCIMAMHVNPAFMIPCKESPGVWIEHAHTSVFSLLTTVPSVDKGAAL